MKNRWSIVPLVAALIVIGISSALAQAPTPVLGDLGSVVTGKWDTVSTWKLYSSNGAFDSTATAAPSSGKNAFVRTGTVVTYETSSNNCKSLVIQSGATLQSNVALPTTSILKINGPNVWVDGNFGSGPTDGLSIETKYNAGAVTIGGSGTINIAQFRPNSSQGEPLVVVFAANANVNYAGGSGTGGSGMYLTNRGLQKNVTVTVNSGVTLTFGTNSNFGLTSSSSSNGNANVTINVNGTVNLPSSNFYLTDSTAYTCALNIGATGTVNAGRKFTPYLSGGGGVATVTVASGGALNILNGGTADFSNPAATVTGAGSFALQAGATINVGASAGLDATNGPVRTAGATFDTAANYAYVGTGLQLWGAMFPDSVKNLTIGSTSIDSMSAAKKVKGILQIDGLLVNNGGLITYDTAIVNGTYQHNTTSGAMPIAKWNVGSVCLVTAPVTSATGGFTNGNQNFYHYKVDSPNHTGAGRLGFDGNTIYGNLIIHNTNDPTTAGNNYVALATKTGVNPINLMGNLLIDSTAGSMSIGTGSGVAIQTLIVHGFVMTKGSLYLNGSGVTNKLLVYGDLTATNSSTQALRGHSATAYADTIFFCGSTPQNFVKASGLTNMTNLSFRVLAGSTLILNDTSVVTLGGIGTFTVDSGATLQLGHRLGVNGNITGVAPNLSSAASYEFNSDSAQVTGLWFPTTVKNLKINDSLGVTLSNKDSVTGTLALTVGALITTDTNKVAMGPAGTVTRTGGYVIGNLQKTCANAVHTNFEVGTANGYSPVDVKVATGSGLMTVKAIQGQHPSTFDASKSLNRYWTLTAPAGIAGADLTFSYLASDVVGTESKYGAWRYTGTGTTWTPLTSYNQVAQHTVLTVGVTSFSDWTLGESSLATAVEPTNGSIPKVFYVDQNYPNPFNPVTKISYGLPKQAHVSIKVYSMLGQEVATLVEGEQAAGIHQLTFEGSRLSSGVYFYRVQAGTSLSVRKMVLLK